MHYTISLLLLEASAYPVFDKKETGGAISILVTLDQNETLHHFFLALHYFCTQKKKKERKNTNYVLQAKTQIMSLFHLPK